MKGWAPGAGAGGAGAAAAAAAATSTLAALLLVLSSVSLWAPACAQGTPGVHAGGPAPAVTGCVSGSGERGEVPLSRSAVEVEGPVRDPESCAVSCGNTTSLSFYTFAHSSGQCRCLREIVGMKPVEKHESPVTWGLVRACMAGPPGPPMGIPTVPMPPSSPPPSHLPAPPKPQISIPTPPSHLPTLPAFPSRPPVFPGAPPVPPPLPPRKFSLGLEAPASQGSFPHGSVLNFVSAPEAYQE